MVAHLSLSSPAADLPTRQRDVMRLVAALLERLGASGGGAEALTVLDCGGGTGRLAVPVAGLGAHVTVVDVSADALATLTRRAGEAGVGSRVVAVQGDMEALGDVVAAQAFDLALLHGVLDAVEPAAALASVRVALRPGGLVSILVANPVAGVLGKVLTGDVEAAVTEVRSWHSSAHLDANELARLCAGAALDVEQVSGVGVFADLLPVGSPGGVTAAGYPVADLAAELESLCATTSPFRDIASQLHLLARRPTEAA